MHLPPTHDTMRDARPESEDYVVLLKSPAQAPAFGPSTPHLRRRPSVQFDDTPKPPRHYTRSLKRGPRRTKRWIAWATLTAVGVLVVLVVARSRKTGASATVDDPNKTCEARGFLSRAINDIDDAQRITVRVTSVRSALPQEGAFVHENTIQPHLFHPKLSSQVSEMFGEASRDPAAPQPSPARSRDDKCIRPFSHVLDFKPRPLLPNDENPELFFALCTSPKRAVRYAQIWSHFMLGSNSSHRDSDDASSAPPPGCLVTDADGTRDNTGMTRANDEFRRHGLGCVMRDTSRSGQRYELRVLGLLCDAWVESELRRWRDGAAVPDWFVFGDDDTWYSDVTMLREFLARHNPADEHFFGTFSGTRQNYEYFVGLTHCVRVYFGLGTLTAALSPHRVRSLSAAAELSSAALCLKKCKLGSTSAPYASEMSLAVTG